MNYQKQNIKNCSETMCHVPIALLSRYYIVRLGLIRRRSLKISQILLHIALWVKKMTIQHWQGVVFCRFKVRRATEFENNEMLQHWPGVGCSCQSIVEVRRATKFEHLGNQVSDLATIGSSKSSCSPGRAF